MCWKEAVHKVKQRLRDRLSEVIALQLEEENEVDGELDTSI